MGCNLIYPVVHAIEGISRFFGWRSNFGTQVCEPQTRARAAESIWPITPVEKNN
jgi:hypothetical protein